MSIDFIAIVSVAFLSSFGHCYSMCGGFNLAFINLNLGAKNLFLLSLFYHLSRIFAYILLGVVFGAFGNILALNAKVQSLSFFILGVFMMILGFALILRGKILILLESNVLFEKIFKKTIQKAKSFKGIKSALILGFANGFVPCGLVYFFLASALSKENFLESVLTMAIFGLSTLPALLFFSKFSTFLSEKFKKFFSILSYILIIIYGIMLAFIGFKGFY
ncbi:MAG: sulfite exporter TauE/SafE family protein [Campylobacter sp.]|nr:sulfite exporter TauE/SafE family protein [Campylobacter sp.]